jgi:hypothetical protein
MHPQPDTSPYFGLPGLGSPLLGDALRAHPSLAAMFAPYERVRLAAAFGSLLAQPSLLANNHRLEVLVHLALLSGRGTKKPDDGIIERAFAALTETSIGWSEDPTEDVFVSNVATRAGNFRVLGGTWESGGFHLQRLLNTLDKIGDVGFLEGVRRHVYAMLRISDALCGRFGLTRNQLGGEMPLAELPSTLRRGAAAGRRQVLFSASQLQALSLVHDDLAPFGLRPEDVRALSSETLGHSTIERYPLIARPEGVYVVLPSAIVPAITRFVIESMERGSAIAPFSAALADEYSKLFSRTHLLGADRYLPVELRRAPGGFVSGGMIEMDHGLYLNFIFVGDTLKGFGEEGALGRFPATKTIAPIVNDWIDQAHQDAKKRPGYVGRLTLVVLCGIGRGTPYFVADKDRDGWRVEMISASGLQTLSWLPDFKPLSLWRMLDAQDRLAQLGIETQNINGLVNLVGWIRQLDGHIVPHAAMPEEFSDGAAAMVMVQQNSLLAVRHLSLTYWDEHAAFDRKGNWTLVRRDENSLFEEDHRIPFYVSVEENGGGWPEALYESAERNWWCVLSTSPATSPQFAYERFRLLKTWIVRLAPVLDRELTGLPKTVVWDVRFEGDVGDHSTELGAPRRTYEQALDAISVSSAPTGETILVLAQKAFEEAFLHADNIAERAILQRTIEGARVLAGLGPDATEVERLLDLVVPDTAVRSQHAFLARDFRDYVRSSIPSTPSFIDNDDIALIKLGLGWRFRDRTAGSVIDGKPHCLAFLNQVVRGLEDDLCSELRAFDRAAAISYAVHNHESAVMDRDQWQRTAGAVLALHNDKATTLRTMNERDFQLSGVLQTSRLLVEFALGECPATGGAQPGQLQMSRAMAKLMLIVQLGGWSDAIRWDAMEPRVRVTPLGDIQANLTFYEEVIAPFGHATSTQRIQESMANYAEGIEDPPAQDGAIPVNEEFPPEFWEAFGEQLGAGILALRHLMCTLDDLGIERGESVMLLRRSELSARLRATEGVGTEADGLADQLTFRPRQSWRTPPDGFDGKDIFPWRFRRRLSMLRLPLIQLDETPDPELLVAPGLIEDAVKYMLSLYHRGDFPLWQLSPKMKIWAGRASDRRGNAFSREVADRLRALGWKAQSEVLVKSRLEKGFSIDYGDIDVLAWKPATGRVLFIECKDVQFRKTDGEIAEQLADFRGLEKDGKRDLLRKHLDRLDVLAAHLPKLQAKLGLSSEPTIVGELIFRNPVPMLYAWEQLRARTQIHTLDQLDQLE